jgi:hypothetical protein
MVMGSGESDARLLDKVHSVEVTATNKDFTLGSIKLSNTNSTSVNSTFDTSTGYYNYTYTWPYTVYLYQIKCPIRACKTMNWLELDKIKPCTKCGARLKAVSEQADFEIPVGT